MPDLVIEYHTLQTSAKNLGGIESEFQNTVKYQQNLAGIWGSDDVEGAMHAFATNWDYHRKGLVSAIDDTLKATQTVLQTFSDVDGKLASSLTAKGKG